MKYFVTGGAGFIGSCMVDKLIESGNVTVYDNLTSGRRKFVEHHLSKPNFKLVVGDLLDLQKVKEAMAGHDFVFHFASNPDIAKSMQYTDLDLKQGIIATYNVLEAMRVNDVKKIAFSSGSGIYGDVGEVYTPEDFGPPLPISMYGASKLAAEGLISAFCHMFDMQAWIFRFANVVGGRQTHGVTLDFINKLKRNPKELEILGDGRQSKSYIHVEECIEAMLFAINNSKERVNVFNVAAKDFIDVTRIAEIVIEEMELNNVKFKYTGGTRGWRGDVPVVRLNTKKINALGWEAKLSSEEAVRRSVRELLNRDG